MTQNIRGSQPSHPNRHVGKAEQPHRVAARQEGVVKNIGTKKIKKQASSK
jgi:hypothetical protein